MTDFFTMAWQWFIDTADYKQWLLIILMPLFLISFAVEFAVMKRRRPQQFVWREIIANAGLGISYQVAEIIYYALFVGVAFSWLYQFRLFDLEMNILTVFLLFVFMEFCYYWFHRVSHRVRWFWCAHVVHHSGETMNMSTAMRQSLTYTLNASHFFWVPLILVGFEPRWVMLALAVNLAYQYFVHTEAVRRLPNWFEFVFNTPSHHRAHHGRNREYIDKNYGGILIIFDRLFGTFEPEVAPVNYGIPKPVNSYNILKLNFHEWRDMFRDVRNAHSWRERLGVLFMPPQWGEKRNASNNFKSE